MNNSLFVCLNFRYATRNQILHENSINEENLAQLIKTIRTFVGYHDSRYFTGFDCILATIFIMSEGSLERLVSVHLFILYFLIYRDMSIISQFCHICITAQ